MGPPLLSIQVAADGGGAQGANLRRHVGQAEIEATAPGRAVVSARDYVELVPDAEAVQLGAELGHPLLKIVVALAGAEHVIDVAVAPCEVTSAAGLLRSMTAGSSPMNPLKLIAVLKSCW